MMVRGNGTKHQHKQRGSTTLPREGRWSKEWKLFKRIICTPCSRCCCDGDSVSTSFPGVCFSFLLLGSLHPSSAPRRLGWVGLGWCRRRVSFGHINLQLGGPTKAQLQMGWCAEGSMTVARQQTIYLNSSPTPRRTHQRTGRLYWGHETM